MEPVTATIVAALVAGAVAATKDVAAQAIRDAYSGLKSLIVRKLGDKADIEDAVEKVEAKPDSKARQAVLEEELETAKASEDAEVMKVAKALLELLEKHGQKAGVSYQATQTGSGAQAQDHSVAAGEGGAAIGRDAGGDVIVGGGKGKDG